MKLKFVVPALIFFLVVRIDYFISANQPSLKFSQTKLKASDSRYIPLKTLAQRWNLKLIEQGEAIVLKGSIHGVSREIKFFPKEVHYCILEGIKVFLSGGLRGKKHSLMLSPEGVELLENLLGLSKNPPARATIKRILLDPGHGGKAQGTFHFGIEEKTINLVVTKKLKEALQKEGYEVFLTHEQDQDIGLQQRSALANQRKADLFISIHHNAIEKKHAADIWGLETYYYNIYSNSSQRKSPILSSEKKAFLQQSQQLGFGVQKEIFRQLQTVDRGLKFAEFKVINSWDLNCPGILIECGYLSHPKEHKQIQTLGYQKKLVAGIVEGIKRFNVKVTSSKNKPLFVIPGKEPTSLQAKKIKISELKPRPSILKK